MRRSFLRYGLFTFLMVLGFGDFATAFIPESMTTFYPCFTVCTPDVHSIATGKQINSTDSLTAIQKADNDILMNHHPKLESAQKRGDTIRRSSNRNFDRLNKNTLSTLKNRGENNFFTRNLFSLMIKDDQPVKAQTGVSSTLYFEPFAGKRIRNIRIQQLDVFGPTLQDTTRKASVWIDKTANTVHLKTTEKKLRGQLLFNPGEFVNPQLMAENEKFIRDLPYIQDVAITLIHSRLEEDFVDVVVIIKEKFEYAINGNLNSSRTEWEVTDQNMFGIGHQFSVKTGYNLNETPKWEGSFNYEISDLDRKFIRTGVGYTNTYREQAANGFIEKQFIASKKDWAGGISLERVFSDHFLTPYSYTALDTAASYFNSDLWYGKQINNRSSNPTIGNVVISSRYFHQNFYHNSSKQLTNSLLRNHDFILGAIGISKRYLFKNNRVYGYGITEDIPYGRYAEVAAGIDLGPDRSRPYFHFNYSKASILNGGAYFKWQIGMGGFLSNSRLEQGAILLSSNFFSNFIYPIRRPYRLFVNMELLSGINRFKEEYLVINRRFGIRDYFSLDTKGIDRLKINVEAVSFWNWHKSGFRFAHYFFADAAFLSNDLCNVLNDRFYAGFGLGIRVHNESLVFNVLEVRLSWIPIAPSGIDPYIFNAFGQPKARFDDFLGGKPHEIAYQ